MLEVLTAMRLETSIFPVGRWDSWFKLLGLVILFSGCRSSVRGNPEKISVLEKIAWLIGTIGRIGTKPVKEE